MVIHDKYLLDKGINQLDPVEVETTNRKFIGYSMELGSRYYIIGIPHPVELEDESLPIPRVTITGIFPLERK